MRKSSDKLESSPAPVRLPAPDQYGNYWLAGNTCAPAILKAGMPAGKGGHSPKHAHGYFVTTTNGPLAIGGDILYFDTPQLALEALLEMR